jgi:hypothetical protein
VRAIVTQQLAQLGPMPGLQILRLAAPGEPVAFSNLLALIGLQVLEPTLLWLRLPTLCTLFGDADTTALLQLRILECAG